MAANGKRILLVEDEAIIALSEKVSLEHYGYNVTIAESGERALEYFLGDASFDLVLMDINLGSGIDGTVAASLMLRERQVPIVFLSSHTERDIVARTESITSFGYVVKNSGMTVLDASMKMAFKLFAAERELRRQNILMRAVMENAPIGFAVNRISDGQGFLVADKFKEIYGVAGTDTDSVEKFFEAVYIDPAQREKMRARILADMGSGDPSRMKWENIPITTRTGEKKVITAMNIPVIEHDLMVSTVQDVTERWKAEQALRESEERFRGYVENASDIVYELSPDGVFTYVSPNWQDSMGEPASQAIGKSFVPYVHPDDASACRAFLDRVIAGDRGMGSIDYRVIRRDGGIRWHCSRRAASRDKNGRVVAYLGIGRDVTAERAAGLRAPGAGRAATPQDAT